MLVDLHVHTRLSSDSNALAEQYLEANARAVVRLGAICLTEHRLFPTDDALDSEYARLADRFGVRIFKGVEADTKLGHLLIFGVTRRLLERFDFADRLLRAEPLIEAVHGEGGVAIPAHPFRDSGYGARLADLMARVGAALVAIEAVNGQNTHEQDRDALAAAEKLGLAAVAGSDAHFPTARWFLTCATELTKEVRTVADLCEELRAGRARPFRFGNGASPVA
jgi:predicted metal-dependent phosphoesterase TrpH